MNTNTQNHDLQIPGTTKSGRTTAHRNGKTTSEVEGAAGAPREVGDTARETGEPGREYVALPASFIAMADEFGMVPARLAERVISAFAATRPTRIVLKRL